jgi:ribonuclease Z
LCEHIRPGRFDAEAAAALGVPFGPLCGALQRGESVTLENGSTVTAAQVMGAPRPARRIVFSGDTRPCAGTLEAAAGADLLIHEATFLNDELERAVETGHSTARQAAELAATAQVSLLALTHLSTRYTGGQVRDEARATFEQTVVPRDLDLIDLPFAERGLPRLVRGDGREPAVTAAPGG